MLDRKCRSCGVWVLAESLGEFPCPLCGASFPVRFELGLDREHPHLEGKTHEESRKSLWGPRRTPAYKMKGV